MPDEKWPEETDREITPDGKEPERVEPLRGDFSIGAILAFLAVAVLGGLIVMGVKRGTRADEGKAAAPEIAALRAEIETSRNELNAQRAALGKAPLGADVESAAEISKRLRRDSDTLTKLVTDLQDALSTKNGELVAMRSKLLESEKLRQTLAVEIGRQNDDLQRARAEGAAVDGLRSDLAAARARADAFASDLAEARAQLKEAANGISPEALADLQRQLEETKRAKEFFEKRAKMGAPEAVPEGGGSR